MDKSINLKTIPKSLVASVSGSVTVSELRIGNLIQKRDDICVLASINTDETIRIYNEDKTDTWGCFALRIFNAIPLTEDWFLKFGYVKKGKYLYCHDNSTRVFKSESCNSYWFELGYDIENGVEWKMITHFEYVHQLQNLYFAISGSEL